MDKSIKLSVLLLKENNTWVAQCLEHDIAAQAKTIKDVKTAFEKTVTGQCFLDLQRGSDPLASIGPAPGFYRPLFDSAEKLEYKFHLKWDEERVAAIVDDFRVCLECA